MASPQTPSASLSRQEVATLVKQVQSNQFFNRQLSSICQVNGLKSTGVKAELQNRIVNLITEAANSGEVSRFHQIKQSIVNAAGQRLSPASKNLMGLDNALSSASPSRPSPLASFGVVAPQAPWTNHMAPLISFRPSPFYHLDAGYSVLRVCEAMNQHRNSISMIIRVAEHQALQKCVDDKSYRIMVFCAADSSGLQDVAFPQQAEIRVNGEEVKANLRGVKNKPGSTRPVDITKYLRLRPNYGNNVEFIYALTSKKYFLVVNLCRIAPVTELVASISAGLKIPKASVVNESMFPMTGAPGRSISLTGNCPVNKKSQDADVVATSQVLSLKCPLSCMRLDVPCRGLVCSHIQCFDASSYLQLQEQGPQWICPICNKPTPFEQLAIDEDILENTSKDVETVTIEPDGRWWTRKPDDGQSYLPHDATNGDDDFCEISSVSINNRRADNAKMETPRSATGPRGIGSTSVKRPVAAVIDLTGDSDEESVQRAPKRVNTTARLSSGDVGFSSSSPGQSLSS